MDKLHENTVSYASSKSLTHEQYEKKLDWMYKSPNQLINREEYLLGRPIDKSFEESAQTGKASIQNHVEHECVPPSLRFFSGNEQVDLIRKMQEDPLYAIKKKEMETRSQLLKNPVKLKQLRQLVEQQTKQASHKNGQKREERCVDDANIGNESAIDILIIGKIQELRERIHGKYIIECIERVKLKSKRKSTYGNVGSVYDSKHKNAKIKQKINSVRGQKTPTLISDVTDFKERIVGHGHREMKKMQKAEKDYNCSSSTYNENSERQVSRGYHERRSQLTPKGSIRNYNPTVKENNVSNRKLKLSEEEKELRRQEMMQNAVWRDYQRKKNTQQYTEEEKQELHNSKSYDSNFIRKQLAATAETGTVASRIKSNINNIQRSDRLMDTNFARR